MRLPSSVACVLIFVGCGGTADLVPMEGDVGQDNGRPIPEVRALSCATTSGEAPYETTCSFEISTRDTDDVLCTMSVSGGDAIPAQLTKCSGGEFKVQVKNVGPAIVEVRAQREGGSSLRASVELAGLNAAPKIKSFTSVKKQGTAPVTTPLNWQVEDGNGDAVTCEIAIDGVLQDSLPDCLGVTTVTHTFQSGEHIARLTVKDSRGGTAFSEVTVRGVQPVGDIRVVKADFGQTVLSPTLRLVPGKPAMVRVFILSDTPNLALTAKLQRIVGGQVTDTVTLTGPATAPVTEDPSMQKTYAFKLPVAWIESNLELRVDADPDDLLPETDEANNQLTLKPAVGEANIINVTAVPVVYNNSTATVPDFQESLLQIFAVKSVGRKDRNPYTFTGSFENSYGGWSSLLGDVASLRNADGSSDHYYGLIDNAGGGGIAGLGFLGQPAAVGLSYYGHVMPHELGHNLSLPHAPCGPVSGASSAYPYAGGEIGTYGINVESMQLIPNTFKDLMSYCQPTWISDYYYKQSQNFLESQSYGGAASTPPQPMILVHGHLTKDGRVTLKPVHRISSWPTPSKGEGLLTVTSARGTFEARFDTAEEAEDGGRHFSVLLRDPGQIDTLKLELRGQPIVARSTPRPSSTATAELAETNQGVRVTWDATRRPSASLAWVKGNERITFAFDLKGGDVEVKTGSIPEGGAFEVSLSDGLNGERVTVAR